MQVAAKGMQPPPPKTCDALRKLLKSANSVDSHEHETILNFIVQQYREQFALVHHPLHSTRGGVHALHYAAGLGHFALCCDLIYFFGAPINVRSATSGTWPVDHSLRKGHHHVTELLMAVSDEREELFGRYCIYEDWRRTSMGAANPSPVAIQGLHSNFIIPEIIASARPTTRAIMQYNLLEQLKSLNVRLIVNLQQPFENAFCGNEPLLASTGFTYDPSVFVAAGIQAVNPLWWFDNTAPSSCALVLQIIDQMISAVGFQEECDSSEQRRVLVHCHAGLGRTGTIIAGYLMRSRGMSAREAIDLVRKARPGSIVPAQQLFLTDVLQPHLQNFGALTTERSSQGQ